MANGRVEVESRETMSAQTQLDESTLDRKNFHYRWVHPRNLGRRVQQGYVKVLRSEDGVRFVYEAAGEGSVDDLLHQGDSFLMKCKKSTYNERRKRLRALSEARLNSSESRFAARARKKGVRPLIGDEGEET